MIGRLPYIQCHNENHQHMPFQFVCLNPHCLKNSQQLACVYCSQQFHKHHISDIKAIKQIICEVQSSKVDTEYGAADILLRGMQTCSNQNQLRDTLSQLISYKDGGKKYEKILDKNMKKIQTMTKNFYQQRQPKENPLEKTVKRYKGQCTETSFISPILTFSDIEIEDQQLSFVSPFCISNPFEGLKTAFAQPPLTKFVESVEAEVKVERITPFWLGIGLSFGKERYEEGSKRHVMLTSNGWISVFGKMQKTNLKYYMKDKVKIKWDKNKEFVEFICGRQKEVVNIRPEWSEEVFLCTVLFYKNDSVKIIS